MTARAFHTVLTSGTLATTATTVSAASHGVDAATFVGAEDSGRVTRRLAAAVAARGAGGALGGAGTAVVVVLVEVEAGLGQLTVGQTRGAVRTSLVLLDKSADALETSLLVGHADLAAGTTVAVVLLQVDAAVLGRAPSGRSPAAILAHTLAAGLSTVAGLAASTTVLVVVLSVDAATFVVAVDGGEVAARAACSTDAHVITGALHTTVSTVL